MTFPTKKEKVLTILPENMKRFLKILFVVGLLAGIGTAESSARMRWGATAGVTVNTLHFKQDLITIGNTVGYEAGIIGEVIFPGIGVGVDLGLMYDQQGAMVNLGQREIWSSLGYGNEHVYIHNIRIPIHLRLKYTRLNGIEDKIAPIVFGGPEFDLQVAHGKCDAFKYSGGDLGLTVGLGAELFKKWQITAGYTWGMTYALKTKLLDQFSAQSRQWSVRVSYFF